jgi:hypothetical protein
VVRAGAGVAGVARAGMVAVVAVMEMAVAVAVAGARVMGAGSWRTPRATACWRLPY